MKTLTGLAVVLSCHALVVGDAVALNPEEAQRWRDDIEFYRSTLAERHIDLYHTVSRKRFDAELDRLSARLEELDDHEVVFELMRITRLIGDGHTQLPIMAGPHRHFPFRFRLFGDEVRVSESSEAYRAYLGTRVVAIDGRPISGVLAAISPAVQAVENEYSLMASLAFHLTVDNMLYAAGVTGNPGSAVFSFEREGGTVTSVPVSSLTMPDYIARTTQRIARQTPFPKPQLRHSDRLWMAADEDTATAYLYFAGYPPFDAMFEFGARVNEFLSDNSVRNLVIDLRDNGGGDFYAGLALSSAILMTDGLDWNDGIYVLIGRRTFSAAMSNAVQFRQILNATLVGEPTGGNPVARAELGQFRLPHSQRMVFYSRRFYRFQAQDTPGVQPDVRISVDAQAFVRGEDPVLEWVMSDVRRRLQRQ